MTASDRRSVYRILDANGNRASEALRVIEEFCRFALDSTALSERVKSLRHRFAETQQLFPANLQLQARDTPGDVGTAITTEAERLRLDPTHVVSASLKRLQQSLRALEEYGKVVSPDAGQAFERMRYEAYELEKEIVTTFESRKLRRRLETCQLYVLIDAGPSEQEFRDLVRQLCNSGVDVIQLRDKSIDDRTLLDRARVLRSELSGTKVLMILNDRADIAALSGADGVHVGQDELSVADVRAIVGDSALVGVSTHNVQQAIEAERDGADYIGCGPTFPSSTKGFDQFPGPSFLRSVVGKISLPAFAIGGIHHDNVGLVLEAGFCRIAVSGAVTNASDPGSAIQELRRAL